VDGLQEFSNHFGDAPDGFSEELKEVTYTVGAEYIKIPLQCVWVIFTKVL
jgi:hypothetical protein